MPSCCLFSRTDCPNSRKLFHRRSVHSSHLKVLKMDFDCRLFFLVSQIIDCTLFETTICCRKQSNKTKELSSRMCLILFYLWANDIIKLCRMCLTCSVGASRGQGAMKGRDLSRLLSLQLCDCFLFDGGSWRSCFGERGWEYVPAFLDTSENTEHQCENPEDVRRDLRAKHTSRLWGPGIVGDLGWTVGALQVQTHGPHRRLHWTNSNHKSVSRGLKDKFSLKEAWIMPSLTRGKLICPVEVACFHCHKQCVKAKIPGKVYFETFITFLLESSMSYPQLGLGF